MTHHMSASIEGLLKQTNRGLEKLLEMNGKEARKKLREKLQAGEKVIPCGDCDGFDPVRGCPGHPNVNGKEITIKAGLKFLNVHMPAHSFEVHSVDPANNMLAVNIRSANRLCWTEIDWNLEHTQWAFERGEYFIEETTKPTTNGTEQTPVLP